MKMRKIDLFLLRKYDEYCHNKSVFNELDSQKSYDEYINENFKFLIDQYRSYRRNSK